MSMCLLRILLFFHSLLFLVACTGVPQGITPVSPFQLDRYLGKWYEIARLDHSFERGLSDVSAQYRRQPDGSIEVINCGYSAEKGAWKEAIGKARFIGEPTLASLQVSFFGPFYGGYHIAALDEHAYLWSLVVGRAVTTCGSCRASGDCPPKFASSYWKRRANSVSISAA